MKVHFCDKSEKEEDLDEGDAGSLLLAVDSVPLLCLIDTLGAVPSKALFETNF